MKPGTNEELIEKDNTTTDPPGANHDIHLWIDCYDDIFSNFDLRAYTSRNISDDFLREVKKVSHEFDLQVDALRLHIPEKIRNEEVESIITRRLHSHFVKNLHYYLKKKKTERKKDIALTLLGISMMVCASFLSYSKSSTFLLHTLLVILEPAGWFLVWISMENLINTKRKEKPEYEFYSKMHKGKVLFVNA